MSTFNNLLLENSAGNMDTSDGFTLIDSLKSIGPDDIPYGQKVLQTTHDKKVIPIWFESLEINTKTQFIQNAVDCYLGLISSAKLARGFFKILIDLPADCQERVKKELETSFETLIRDATSVGVKKLCELLNVNTLAKAACKKFITPTSGLVHDKLNMFAYSSKTKEQQDSEILYHAIKMCIHCLQTCSENISECLFKPDDDVNLPTSDDLKSLWSKIFQCLLSLLFQNTNQELIGLIGTAISMLLNLSPSREESCTACKEILLAISTDKETASIFGIPFKKPPTKWSSEEKAVRVLMLTKSLLMTSHKDMLCYRTPGDNRSFLFYLYKFFFKPCSGPQVNHYLAFQVMALWYKKLKAIGIRYMASKTQSDSSETLKDCEYCEVKYFMSSSCPILTTTLPTIWLHWDSPVDGVPDSITTIFSCLMNLWAQAVKDKLSNYLELSAILTQALLMMSWQTKTRYRPLSILLPFVDVFQVLNENPDLKEDLVKCMGVNGLAAVASDAYTAFLTEIKIQDEKNALSLWCDLWMPTLIKGITSPDPTQRLKICTYWIPCSMKIIPGSHTAILDCLQNEMKDSHRDKRIQNLLAWTTVCRYSRDIVGMPLQDKEYSYVKEALVCIDDDVRAEALFLLCITLKRATPVSNTEIKLLKSFIPVNLKTDSAAFRQSMVTALKKLITRIRDSCLSEVKCQRLSSDTLTNGIHFIDWLFNTLIQNLFPGGTYQCRQTTLDLLEVIFNLLVFQERHSTKKGMAQERSDVLMEFANNSGKWLFFKEQTFFTLLSCLEDGSDDIQTQSYRLLAEFFPWPNASQWKHRENQNCQDSDLNGIAKNSILRVLTDEKTVCNMINKALSLSSSPKSYETHSGLLLMSLVFKKYVETVGLVFTYDDDQCKVTAVSPFDETSSDFQCPSVAFLDMMMYFLEASVRTAYEDPAAQFKSHPIHGLTQYVTHCIKHIFSHSSGDRKSEVVNERCDYLVQMKIFNEDVIDLMLDIMSGGDSLDKCPSFAEMGVALKSLISAEEDDGQEYATTLSPEFQLLLSWCWINLKECCSSLGQVTVCALKVESGFLPATFFGDIGDVFTKVLTTCRHRGAIEGCRSGFSLFCEALLDSKKKECSAMPKAMLDAVVESLHTNSLSASISRRSAGLPIIVEVVIIQVIKASQYKQFLISIVDEFYAIASEPLAIDHDQTRDYSQVHAFNILKSVFSDANLASHLGPLLSKLTILVIENFDSPSWAIRNATTQLISTLVMRIFGQRNKSSGSMTLEEFNSLHPELVQYIVIKLQHLSSMKNVINPSLYIVLTLLSHLVMAPSHLHQCEKRVMLQKLVRFYLDNPVYSLRNLAAKARVALYPLDKLDGAVSNLVAEVSRCRDNLNYVHGHLLCMSHLISSDTLSQKNYQKLMEFCCGKHVPSPRPFTCAVPFNEVMHIMQKLLRNGKWEMPEETLNEFWSFLEFLFSEESKQKPDEVLQVGMEVGRMEIFTSMTLLVKRCPSLQQAMSKFICSSLSSPDPREAIISTLHTEPHQNYLEQSAIWATLWHTLLTECRTPVFVQTCEILYQMYSNNPHAFNVSEDIFYSSGQDFAERWRHIDSIKSAILALDGVVYNNMPQSDCLSKCNAIQVWCDTIIHFGRPLMSENLRLWAVRGLKTGGKNILDMCTQNLPHVAVDNIIVSIMKATIQFLEDPETNVREEASVFVSSLMGVEYTHSNLAFQMLTQYIAQHLSCCVGLNAYLLEQLYVYEDLLTECKRLKATESQRLFEPERESILLEVHVKQIWAFKTLKGLSENERSETSMQLEQKCFDATRELLFQLSLDMDGFRNYINDKPRVIACMLGVILLDKLCHDVPTAADLHKLVESVLKVPSVHPLLQLLWDEY